MPSHPACFSWLLVSVFVISSAEGLFAQPSFDCFRATPDWVARGTGDTVVLDWQLAGWDEVRLKEGLDDPGEEVALVGQKEVSPETTTTWFLEAGTGDGSRSLLAYQTVYVLDESANLLRNGDFEAGETGWLTGSSNFATPICDVQSCRTPLPDFVNGSYWCWFGGTNMNTEEAYIEQTITIPSGVVRHAELRCSLAIDSRGGEGWLRVLLDDRVIACYDSSEVACEDSDPQLSETIAVPADLIATGRRLRLEARTTSDGSDFAFNFLLDDIALVVWQIPEPDEEGAP